MKKPLLLGALLLGSLLSGNAQTVLLDDSFETYEDFVISGFGDWITIDTDGSDTYTGGGAPIPWETAGAPQAYLIFNPGAAGVMNADSGTEIRNFDPHTGDKYAASWAAVMPAQGGMGPNDDWLVTPAVTLGASENEVSFWVKSMSPSYGLEEYEVGIYVGDGTPTSTADFTMLSTGTLTAAITWTEISYMLNDYAGQTVRIGVHCVSVDHYMFMVDDFMITTAETAGVNNQLASQFSVFPNPAANVINLSNNNNILVDGVQIIDLNGRTVKSVKYDGVTSAQINIADLSSGMYMMNVSSDKGTMTKKIVKN